MQAARRCLSKDVQVCCSTWGEGSVGAEVPGLWQLQLLGVPLESP